MINATVKKYFTKFGFSDKVLQVLSDSISGSMEDIENAEESEINEACKPFDSMAKTFQSEIESRVALDRKKSGKKKGENLEDDEDEGKGNPPVDPTLKAILERLDKMEKGNISGDLVKKASEILKTNHGLTESQTSAILYGRTFETTEAMDEFIEAQKSFQETILKEDLDRKAGNGYSPPGGKGDVSKASIENDIKNFNEKY